MFDTMTNYTPAAQLVAFVAGIGLHLVHFKHGEHSARATMYVQVAILSLTVAATSLHVLAGLDLGSSLSLTASVFGSLFLGLYASLLTYRGFLHPLNRFPGPRVARLGDLWLTWQARDFAWHKKSQALYEKYGAFVRIGSSTLMILHPLGVPAMYGSQSHCHRAEWYGTFGAPYGIISRAPGVHRERRRIWSQAVKESALRGYETRVQKYVRTFREVLGGAARERKTIDVAKWCTYFAWDVMGDLGLNQDFSLLRNGGTKEQEHWAFALVAGWTKALGARFPPWLVTLLKAIPGSGRAVQAFQDFCNAQLEAVRSDEKGDANSSMLGIMVSHAGSSPSPEETLHLQSDTRSLIFAGSDTSASTLTFTLYYLARHPDQLAKLRRELLPLASVDGVFKHSDIQNASHLKAVINEALRLQPPGSIIPRQTPPEGIMVGETFIPGDVTVIGSQYVLGHSEEVYARAEQFIPERWYSEPELIKDRSGFAPFNVGTHYCVGKPLAMMVFRLLIADIVTKFNVGFSAGDDSAEFLDKVEEAHTWRLPTLQLTFSPVV